MQAVRQATKLEQVLPDYSASERLFQENLQKRWSPEKDEKSKKFHKDSDFFTGRPFDKELKRLKITSSIFKKILKVSFNGHNEATIKVETKGGKGEFYMTGENRYWRFTGFRSTHIKIR